MQKAIPHLALLVLAGLLPLMQGCQKIEARTKFKEGNAEYKVEHFKEALELFEQGLGMDPDATFVWRSVGLSAMAMFKPGNKNPENLAFADKAIEAFKKYLADFPESEKSLEYLINTYINADRIEDAMVFLREFSQAHPDRGDIQRMLVTILTKGGKIQEALDWANQHELCKNDPEVFYTIGVNAWDKSYNDIVMTPEQRTLVVDTGLTAMTRALELKKDFQTLVYFNLLYREKAKMFAQPTPDPKVKKQPTPDPERQAKFDEYTAMANKYAAEASEQRKIEEALKSEQAKPIPGTEETPTPVPAEPAAESTPGAEASPTTTP